MSALLTILLVVAVVLGILALTTPTGWATISSFASGVILFITGFFGVSMWWIAAGLLLLYLIGKSRSPTVPAAAVPAAAAGAAPAVVVTSPGIAGSIVTGVTSIFETIERIIGGTLTGIGTTATWIWNQVIMPIVEFVGRFAFWLAFGFGIVMLLGLVFGPSFSTEGWTGYLWGSLSWLMWPLQMIRTAGWWMLLIYFGSLAIACLIAGQRGYAKLAAAPILIIGIGWGLLQISVVRVIYNRAVYQNALLGGQTDHQKALQNYALPHIDWVNQRIYELRQREVQYGGLKAADQAELDRWVAFAERQKTAAAKGEPTVNVPRFKSRRMKTENYIRWAVLLCALAFVASRITKSFDGASAPHA